MNQTDYQVIADAKTLVYHFLTWYMDKFGEYSGGYNGDTIKSIPERMESIRWNDEKLVNEIDFMLETLQAMKEDISKLISK